MGFFLLCLSGCKYGLESLTLSSKDAQVIDQGSRWVSASQALTPPLTPPHALQSVPQSIAETPQDAFPVTFPYQQPKDSTASHVVVNWFYIDLSAEHLAAAADNQPLQLYIPRLYITGSAAIYWGNQRLWQTADSHFYNGFYEPIWLALPVQNPQSPQRLWIRTAAYSDFGQTLSRLWIGSPQALSSAHSLRKLLQTGMIRFTQYSYWTICFWVSVIWLFYRRYHSALFHFWFILIALTVPLTFYSYLPAKSLGSLSDHALFWLTVMATVALNHALIMFIGSFVGVANRLLSRLSLLFTVVALSVFLWLALSRQSMSVDLFSTILPWLWIPFILYVGTLLVVVRKKPNAKSIVFLISGIITILTSTHDILLHQHQQFAEGLLWSTFTYPTALVIMLFFMLNNYIKALQAKENANETLKVALLNKERALTKAHKKLLKIEAEQTLAQERQRLMQEMHDGVGSSLVYAIHSINNRQDGTASSDAQTVEILQSCMEDLKIAIDSLEPINGDVSLLLGNLRYRLDSRFRDSNIVLNWQVTPLPPLDWLEADNSIHILRILQEVLTNIFKYSGARHLTVSTQLTDEEANTPAGILIGIKDDGTPFHCPPCDALRYENKGIANIRQRTRQLQGRCCWQPLTNGNQFSLWLPIVRPPV